MSTKQLKKLYFAAVLGVFLVLVSFSSAAATVSDNSTSPFVEMHQCVFDSIILMMEEIQQCQELGCILTTVFDMVIHIIECTPLDERFQCVFDALFAPLEEMPLCDSNMSCVLGSLFDMVIQIMVCVGF